MIPVLFKEDEQIFTHNGIGALYESLSCDVIEVENGAFTMELEYPVDGELFSEIKDFRIIQAKPNDIDEPHNFRIYEIEKSIDELTVYVRANTRTNDLGNNLITNYVGRDVTPQQAMNGMKNNLIEPTNFDFVSDIQTKSNVEWTRINPLNAIVGARGSLVDIWGGEIKRTNNAIHLYSRRGKDNVVTIRPGKNIEGLNMTVSTAGLVTKILPTFTYRPADVPMYQIVTLTDGTREKRRVPTSGGTTIRDDITVLGDVVSSQYVDNYPTNYWSSVDYGDDDELKNKVDDYIDTRLTHAEESYDIVDMSEFDKELKNFVKTELDKRAKQYFTHRNPGVDKPTVRIQVNMLQLSDSSDWEEFKDLERIGLTDTLDVWVDEYDIDVEVRVTSLSYDSIAEQVINFNAGSDRAPRQSAIEKKYDDLTQATNDYITSFKNGVQNIMRNTADGLNRKFEGYTEPPAELSSEGDIWFKEIGLGKVEIWIYDGVYWQPLMTEDFVEQVVRDVAATQEELEEAKQQAKRDADLAMAEAMSHADAEVARINMELSAEVGGAIALAEQAKADAVAKANQAFEDAKAHAEAEDARIQQEIGLEVDGAIALAEQAKQDVIDKANQALVDANAHADAEIVLIETHFDGIIEGVESDVADAKQTADDALYKINNDIANKFTSLDAELVDIEAMSNTAQANAQTALSQSQDALGDASAALTNASQALTEVQNKVDTFDFDNTVGIINTGIQDAMDEAELATNTLRDSTGQLIKSQDLKVDIDGITSSLTSYAKTTDLNGLATETFVTNKGYQTAAQVSSTLGAYAKTTDLNGLVSQTWVENKGYATASEVSSELSSYAKTSDLTGLATESYVTTRGYQTASQISTTLSAYEKTSTLNTKLAGKANVGDIPSLVGYAKESWVENKSYATAASVATSLKAYEKITDVNAKLADKADIDDIPDITGLASETWVENKSYATAASITTQLSSYAKTSQLTGLATETFVTNKGYQTAAQVTTTLSSYAKTTDLSGLATETYVTSRGYQTASQITTTLAAYAKTSQLSGLATETFVTNKGYQTASQVSTTLSSYVKTSTLSGYATVATVNAIKSTADTNKATISTNTGNISTIEQNVSGLQTTVASKASQTQVTQLANGLSAVVSKTDQISEWTRSYSVNTANPKELVDINGDQLSKRYSYEITLGIPSTGTVTNFIASLTSNSAVNAWTLTIHQSDGTSSNHPYVYLNSSGYPMVSVYSHTSYYTVEVAIKRLASRSKTSLTMLSDNINLRVAKNDVINQINISTEGILIDGKNTHITGTTKIDTGVIKNAHIGDLNAAKITAGTINAARLDATAIVTAGLTANVIKSTHLETSTATITKLFATDAAVGILTAKTAFINSVQAVDISAARITSGTINAARLNATAIVTAGLTANVIKSTHIETNTATVEKLFATDAMITTLTAKTAFINSIKAVNIDAARITTGVINAARLNASAIVTAGLTASVIKGTHITADTALFDKLFSTSSATDRLSARSAWIKNANIANAEINGAKIVDATIDSAKIASLDVGKISGNTTEFVRSAWNSGLDNVTVDASGMYMTGSGAWRRTYLTATGLDLYAGDGANNKAGAIGYLKPHSSVASASENYIDDNANVGHYIGMVANRGWSVVLGYHPNATIKNGYQRALQVDSDTGNIRVFSSLFAGRSGYDLRLRAYDTSPNYGIGWERSNSGIMFAENSTKIWDSSGQVWDDYNMTTRQKIGFYGNSGIQTLTTNKNMEIWAGGSSVIFYTSNSSRKFVIADGGVAAYANLNMNSYGIINQSDSRLKTNITKANDNSLEKITNLEFVDFKWLSSGKDDFGVIAQQVKLIAPELIAEGEDGYLGINNTRLNMMTVHSVKELALRELNTNKIASQALQATETNEEKIERLEKRIEELESVM